MRLLVLLAVMLGVLGLLLLIVRGARRFEARQRASGAWDENGPKEPAAPPPPNERLAPHIATQQQWGLGGG